MRTLLGGDVAAALAKADEIYANGADLTMLLNDMMEWTHWATRMHPALHAGNIINSPYTADMREQIGKIIAKVSLNTLSRIWQVMVAAVSEMQAAGNQKQCFDMLIVRMMHIADIAPIPDLLKQASATKTATPTATAAPATNSPAPTKQFRQITSATDLAAALQEAKEILLYSYYSANIEISEFTDGHIKFFDRKGDADFVARIGAWLHDKTGHTWKLERVEKSEHAHTVTEQAQSELETDPLVSSAMNLFADAQIIGFTK